MEGHQGEQERDQERCQGRHQGEQERCQGEQEEGHQGDQEGRQEGCQGDQELSTVEEPIQETHVSVSHYNLICYVSFICR